LFVLQVTEAGSTAPPTADDSHVVSNVTSQTTAVQATVTAAVTGVARVERVVGDASFGQAVMYAESLTATGFDGTYRCIASYNDTDIPRYTILHYNLDVGKKIAFIYITASLTRSNYVIMTRVYAMKISRLLSNNYA